MNGRGSVDGQRRRILGIQEQTKTELETLCYTEPDPVIHHILKLALSAFYVKLAVCINDEGGVHDEEE